MSNEGTMICFILTLTVSMCAVLFIKDEEDEIEEFSMRRDVDFR